ncbi:hypothetical protein VNO77_09798 [Canavalia gladiata]|uniref:Uncharacterized protein n=1 Tax=Canavalia gladiata TaxID=3824 RepID=A0AAN9MA97_CANGL
MEGLNLEDETDVIDTCHSQKVDLGESQKGQSDSENGYSTAQLAFGTSEFVTVAQSRDFAFCQHHWDVYPKICNYH